jgi:hypothetical protein
VKRSFEQETLPLAVAWSMFAALLFFILVRLDAGVDITDTAFYLISVARHAQIIAQVTLFGALWDGISPFSSIYWNRILALALIVVSSSYLAWAATKYVTSSQPAHRFLFVSPLCAATALAFYNFWLPDPSYDLMNLILVSTVLGSFFQLIDLFGKAKTPSARSVLLPMVILGAAGLSLALVKVTTAALIAPLVIICLLWTARRVTEAKVWIASIAGALLGMALTVLLLISVGLYPAKAIDVLIEGYYVAQMITDPHFNILGSLRIHAGDIRSVIEGNPYLLVSFILLGVLSTVVAPWRTTMFTVLPWIRGAQAATLIVVIVILSFDRASPQVRLSMLGLLAQMMVICSIAASDVKADIRRRALSVVAVAAYGQMAYCFGTNSPWSNLLSLATLLALIPAAVFYGTLARSKVIYALALVGGSALITATSIERSPYRLNSTFSALTESVEIGPNSEPFKVSPALARFYRNLQDVRGKYFGHGDVPVLLDMTGRAPMAAYQLGARIPGTAWTLAGYSGSSDFFRYFVSRLSDADRRAAWLLVPDGTHPGIPLSLLPQLGIDFPGHYVPVTEIPIPFIDGHAILYRPG